MCIKKGKKSEGGWEGTTFINKLRNIVAQLEVPQADKVQNVPTDA